MRKVQFILSGLIPLLSLLRHEPDSELIYSVFVVACLFRRRLAGLADHLPGPPALYLLLFFLVSGSLAETFAWMGNYSKAMGKPILLHPQIIPDLILGVGLYTGWAIAWLIVLRWYRFSLAETFLITGFQAIFFEELGRVFLRMVAVFFANPLLSLLMALYVFAVHASVVGLAMVPVIHRFDDPSKSRHWSRFVLVIVLVVGLTMLCTGLMGALTKLCGGLPPEVDHRASVLVSQVLILPGIEPMNGSCCAARCGP